MKGAQNSTGVGVMNRHLIMEDKEEIKTQRDCVTQSLKQYIDWARYNGGKYRKLK